MRPRGVRQLVDLSRSVGQQIGDAEPRRDVDRLRDPIAPNEGQKLLALAKKLAAYRRRAR